MKLSIIIPAHNEERRLPKTLQEYGRFFSDRFGKEVELIVVAGHCSDDTVAIARKAAESFSQIKVVVEPRRIGKGGAVASGMQLATGNFVGFIDADGATPAETFNQLLQNIGDNGCIIGSRWIEGAVVSPMQPRMRRLASRVLNKVVVHGLFDLSVHDSQCGAKLFRRDVLEKILPDLREPGWAFDIELLCRIKWLGYSIREFPIEWHHVPGNPTTFMLMSLQMVGSVWRVKKALSRLQG